MRDIFITTQIEMLSGWAEAFPKAIHMADYLDFVIAQNLHTEAVFWLHMNVDRQQWMTKTMQDIHQRSPAAKIVILANVPNQAEAFFALSSGAQGYCHAYSPSHLLKEVKTVVSHGGIWMGNEFLKELIHVTTNLVGNTSAHVAGLLQLLTKREQEVAIEAAKGLSNKEIARILNITDRTVKAHLSSAFETLGAKDRLHLALMLNDKSNI